MLRLIILFFWGLGISTCVGQLNGTYTIGGVSPDFSTFSAAVSSLSTNGVNGPVVFNFSPGTYNQVVTIGNISGASEVNTITFQSLNMDSSSVILQTNTSNPIVNLIGTSHVRFRHLTFLTLNTTTNKGVYSTGGHDIEFSHNYFEGNTLTSQFNKIIIELITSNNVRIENNRFYKGGRQISASNCDTLLISNNFLSFAANGIICISSDSVVVSHNSFSGNITGVRIQDQSASVFLNKNYFNINGLAFDTDAYSSPNSDNLQIQNNFIITYSNGSAARFASSRDIDFFNNSIYSSSSSAAALIFNTSLNQIAIVNNIFKVNNGLFYSFVGFNLNPTLFLSNNNGFYTQNAYRFKMNTTTVDLPTWKTLTSEDLNSINFDPLYISATDLHVNNNLPFNNTGQPLANIIDDYDDELRSLTNPDIGADEFDINYSTFIDLELVGLISPDTLNCTLTNQLSIEVRNHSNFQVDSFLVQAWVFDNLIDSVWISIPIPANNTINAPLNQFDFNTNTLYDLRFEIYKPNNLVDNNPTNNDYQYTYYVYDDISIINKLMSDCNTDQELIVKNVPSASILWSTGETDNSIFISSPGTYSVTVTAENGCVVTDSITIN